MALPPPADRPLARPRDLRPVETPPPPKPEPKPDLKPDPERTPQPIPWVRVHNLPDYACFDHRAHATVGITCQKCHGPVESMERLRQEEPLSMGWCINCHRESNAAGIEGQPVEASLDCAACHY